MIKGILILSSILFAFYLYTLDKILDFSKEHNLHNYQSCEKIPIEMPTEDLAIFGDYIIGASNDFEALFSKHLGAGSISPGCLFSYHTKTKKVSKIAIKRFPENLQMNPHGISLYNNKTLYVISHSLIKGGEGVFVFDLFVNIEVEASFVRHISLGNDHGLYNAIAVVDSQYFFLSQWSPFPDTESGRDQSLFISLYRTFLTLYTHTNGVKLCMAIGETGVCSYKLRGYMPNGLFFKDHLLYVTDSITRVVDIYFLDKTFELTKVGSAKVGHATDNLSLNNGVIYVTGISRVADALKYGKTVQKDLPRHLVPGGVSKVYKENGKWLSKEVIMQGILNFPTGVAVTADKIILSGLGEPALLVCSLK